MLNNSSTVVKTINSIQFLSNSILVFHKIGLYYIWRSDKKGSFKGIYQSIQLQIQYFIMNYKQFLNYYKLEKSLDLFKLLLQMP